MVKISVVIPVYNVEKYLNQCLDSVTKQSLSDIEIICVDDGSTDTSGDILEKYALEDERIRIFSQTNRGAGASRNFAISQANGEYVYFMDADDYLEENALEEMYSKAHEKSLDFLMFRISNFDEKTGKIIDDDYYSMPYLKKTVGDDAFNYSDVSKIALDLCVCPPGNLFKREFIADIRFPEGLLFEDNVFFTHALFKAQRICFLDRVLYHRRKRLDSTSTVLTVKSLDTIDISDILLDLCDEFGHESHKGALYYRIFNNIYHIFKRADDSQKEEFFEKIKSDYTKHRDKWEKDDYFRNNLKPKYMHMYKCAVKSKNAKKFEKCVDGFSDEGKLKRLRKRLL